MTTDCECLSKHSDTSLIISNTIIENDDDDEDDAIIENNDTQGEYDDDDDDALIDNDEDTEISKWYAGRSVLITGATGFVGKVLIEKLLRSCPDIVKIFVLIRFKKGKKPEERLAEMINLPLFDKLKQCDSTIFEKLQVINGDLSLPNLNLSDADQLEIINNVSIIFHCGANNNIYEQIKPAILTNAVGTKSLLRLSNRIHELQAFVFLSTIYAHCKNSTRIEESVKLPPNPALKIAESILSFREDSIEKLGKEFLGSNTNIFHYSKGLAEQILIQESNVFPICIVRGSIATASFAEPFPGWIDNAEGPTDIIIGTGKGFLRSYLGIHHYTAELIPVDILVNCLITAGWSTSIDSSKSVRIYNCTTGKENRLTWGQFNSFVPNSTRKYPFEDVVWFPRSNLRQSIFLSNLFDPLLHTFPAYVFDLIFVGMGKSPRFVKNHSKYRQSVKKFEFYTTHQWDVDTTNIHKLQNILTESDKNIFNFDVLSISWPIYFDDYVKGVRKYVLNEDESSMIMSQSHLKKMFIIHQSVQMACVLIFTYVFTHPLVKGFLRQTMNNLILWYRQYDVDVPITETINLIDFDSTKLSNTGFSLNIITSDEPLRKN